MSNTPQGDLYKETDARFWASTGFKPGHKLDPSNPTDAAMQKVWWDTFAKVRAEDEAGKLSLTHDHPVVKQAVAAAAEAHQATVSHVEAASTATTPAEHQHHARQAAQSAQVVKNKMAEARAVQPPTVSPVVVHEAATQAHVIARKPLPRVVVRPDHPGQRHPHWHPHPSHNTGIVPAGYIIVPILDPQGQPVLDPATGYPQTTTQPAPSTSSAPSPPQTAEDHVALDQAANAPATAASSYQSDSGAAPSTAVAPQDADPATGQHGHHHAGTGGGGSVDTKWLVIGGVVLGGGILAAVLMSKKGR